MLDFDWQKSTSKRDMGIYNDRTATGLRLHFLEAPIQNKITSNLKITEISYKIYLDRNILEKLVLQCHVHFFPVFRCLLSDLKYFFSEIRLAW